MTSLLRELAEPFERMPAAEASALLAEHYALEAAVLKRLDTERDDTFRVTLPSGDDLVVKVAHPADDPGVITLQTAAMSYARERDPALPLQRVLPTVTGNLEAVVGGRVARVMTWLSGDLLAEIPPTPQQLRRSGAMLARLAAALSEFDHPSSRRTCAWDLQQLGVLRCDNPTVQRTIDSFTAHVEPQLASLPHQVIHNDFNPSNVLVRRSDPAFVVGILDFGDTLYSARVIDVAVSLAYFIPDTGAVWPTIQPFIDGYDSVTRLEDDERRVLPGLVAARLVQRIVIPAALSNGRNDVAHSIERNTRLLDNLLSEG